MSEAIQRVLTSLSDSYAVERSLGGGMAAVFVALDRKHGRRVAIKVFDPDLTAAIDPQRFLREIRVTAGLQHPHILPLLDSGSVNGTPYYVMPYVEGETLRDHLDRDKRLPLESAVGLTREMASALDYAHAQGIVHRDIKPANVLLSGGHAVIADFGVARAMIGDVSRLTQTGSFVGTPLYMSPEQIGGAPETDGRADQYALGCVVFEMLAGAPPFNGPTADSVAYQHLSVPPPPVTNLRPGLPAGVADTIGRALAKVPADRYPSAAAFAAALEQSASARGPIAGRTPTPSVPMRRPLGQRWVTAAILGVTLATIAIGVWFEQQRRGPIVEPIRAIAVLPLDDLTGDEARVMFADGMTEELITELSKIGSVRVSARSAVMRYRGTRTPLSTVARELHVDALVEGSVLRAANRIRITARLIDPSHEQELWSQTYEREIQDVLAMQAGVARAVAEQLGAEIRPEEVTRLAGARPVDPGAHEAALRGYYLLDRIDNSNYRKALQFFEQAIHADPTYAMAWAGVADTYYLMSSIYEPAAEAIPKARAAARNALAIDPDLAPALVTLAMVQAQYEFNWAAADSSFRRAIALNPSLARAHAYYAYVLTELGRYAESVAEWKKAIDLDPFSAFYATGLGSPYYFAGQHQDAVNAFQRAIRGDTTYAAPHQGLALVYVALARNDEAIDEARRAVALANTPYSTSILGYTYAKAGRRREALGTIDRMLHHPEERVEGLWLARIYATLGMKAEAFTALERSMRDRDEDALLLAVDPALAPLRFDDRFRALLREMKLAG